MKPVSVRFRCFGPYMAEQFIDFRELERSGLFLICGETGAGKTTILDAICYALYGRSSGGLRGDLEVMRCKLAGKEDETLVEFIFDVGQRRYKFIRTLKYGRKNLNDSHNCLELRDGEYVPIFENPKATLVNHQAEVLIGLTYDQFRQVIILPQGQFEKLLVSNSEEKEKILVSLFHADRWQRMAEELARRVNEQDQALKQEKLWITAKLKDYGCGSLEELAGKLSGQAEAVAQAKVRAQEGEQALAVVRGACDAALIEDRAFAQLKTQRALVDKLLAESGHFERESRLLSLAEQADRLRPQYTAYRDALARKTRAEQVYENKKLLLARQQRELDSAKARWDAHAGEAEAQEQRKKKLTLLENAREVYAALEEKQKTLMAARRELEAAAAGKARAEGEFQSRDRGWQDAMTAQNRAFEDYRHAQNLYLQGIGSTLAGKLEPGQPCPVCGSRDHPQPAQPAQGHISDRQLEEKNQAVQASTGAVSRAKALRDRAEQTRTQALARQNQVAQAEAVARTDYENALARKLPEIGTQQQLDVAIRCVKLQVAEFDRAEEVLAQALQTAAGSQQGALAAQNDAREEWTGAVAAFTAQSALWQEALTGSGLGGEEEFTAALMEPEEKQRRSETLIRYRTELEHARRALEAQQAALEGKTAPDLAGLMRVREVAEQESKDLAAALALARSSLAQMEKDHAGLSARLEKYHAARVRVDEDLEFANRLRGRSGISLQRYVLGVMLTSVTVEANRLLAGVYSGRYQLYRTDAIAGSARKGGLELEVWDSQNSQRRSVTTLSGGEKFLVALSLAIGLSTVVQAQGSGLRLEAMFIDEGFGSLDREAVGDALGILQGIQQSSGVVGIISHVEALAESIPTRIEITKGKNGSGCRCVY